MNCGCHWSFCDRWGQLWHFYFFFRGIYNCTHSPQRMIYGYVCKSTHVCPPMSVCVCVYVCVCVSTSEEKNNNGMAHWVRPDHSRIQRRRAVNWRGQAGGRLGRAIFLLSACQTKVRERLRGVRWQGTEVGSPFQAGDGLENKWHSIFRGPHHQRAENRGRDLTMLSGCILPWSLFTCDGGMSSLKSNLTAQQGGALYGKKLNTL